MPVTYTIKGIAVGSHDALLGSVNCSRPKSEDDYFNAAECRSAFNGLIKDRNITKDGGRFSIDIVLNSDLNDITLSESAFRFLERVFKEVREGGQVFEGRHAESVVEAIKIMKAASSYPSSAVDDAKKDGEGEVAMRGVKLERKGR